MKFVKALLILLILLVSSQFCSGQEKSEAILFDRFAGDLPCGDIMGRTDNFLYELLKNDPKSQGYVIIYPEKNSLKTGLRLERIISGNIYVRRFNKSRITIIRSKKQDASSMAEFWKVPFGAAKPSFVEEKWSETPITKSFIFRSIWGDDACPTFIPENYANLIKDNLYLRGHIVIFNKSKKDARKEMKQWLELFAKEYKVPRNRLKFFFSKNGGMPDVEFWIVLTKK
ncbi:MAG TPA: hypothetical protein VGB00_12365 [Pyrinomonadaceae bacterium]|jgi:hypothetical protein